MTSSLSFLVTVLVIWCWALWRKSPDAPVALVDLPLGFPPATGSPSAAGPGPAATCFSFFCTS